MTETEVVYKEVNAADGKSGATQPALRPARISSKMKADVEQLQSDCDALTAEVAKVIVGKKNVLRLILVNILSQGNILFEDFPGLAKTVMAMTFAHASGCDFKRIQFTPDVLPADITGAMVYDQKAGKFTFRKGPVFTNILLADEINRAPPKTQSALLEAMQERQVSVEGTTHKLKLPYIVMATQNPVEQEGTYPLPEAQMDRFLMKLSVGYPDQKDEAEIGRRRISRGKDDFDVKQITSAAKFVKMQNVCEQIHVSDAVLDYIAAIVVETRNHKHVQVGSSPRGTLALIKAGRAWAAMEGRAFVTPDDVHAIAPHVLAHRIIMNPDARFSGITGHQIIDEILEEIPAPTV